MGVYIKGIEMPKKCGNCKFCVNMNEYPFKACFITYSGIPLGTDRLLNCPLAGIKTPHGRLIDANKLEAMMYHEAFETDSDMQKWDGGCWIRYKVFENCMNRLLPDTIIEAEE